MFRGKQQTDRLLDRRSSFLDANGKYWYGTWGLGLYGVDLGTGRVLHYGYESRRREESIVASIAEGTGDTLWTAAWRDGVMKFDRGTGKIRRQSGDSRFHRREHPERPCREHLGCRQPGRSLCP